MAILVQYRDETFDAVPNKVLDDLIAADKIIAFRRSSGWAEIGRDPIRGQGTSREYEGPERRIAPAVIFAF
jgi:hypothetical protein